MFHRSRIATFCLVVLLGATGAAVPRRDVAVGYNGVEHNADAGDIYVDPALLSDQSDVLSVIVTASDSSQAAIAVEQAGGQVTSDLWLIKHVAAEL